MAKTVAVIGAGVSGLACARALQTQGLSVILYDKGRGPGGRLSTRRTEHGSFDHGAPYFSVRDPQFATAVADLRGHGHAAPWGGAAGETGSVFVGTPSMNAVVKGEALALGAAFGIRVAPLCQPRAEAGFALRTPEGEPLIAADAVVVATPAEQAAELLAAVAPDLAAAAKSVTTHPQWTGLFVLPPTNNAPREVLRFTPDESPLAMIVPDHCKPDRAEGARFVVHAHHGWSADNLEIDKEEMATVLWSLAAPHIGGEPIHASAHRWRYAQVTDPLSVPYLLSDDARIGACGDYCSATGVEGAWQSGTALGERLSERLKST